MKLPKSIIYLLLASTLFTSCSKDDENAQPQGTPFNAFPTRTGATWVYDVTTSGGSVEERTQRITGDTVFSGNTNTFKIVQEFRSGTKLGESYFYIVPSTGDVVQRAYINPGSQVFIENNIQVGRVFAGKKWSETINVTFPGLGTIPTKYDWNVDSVGLTRTIRGVNYTNVMKLTSIATSSVSGSTRSVYYFSNNIGTILFLNYSPSGSLFFARELKSYTP